MVQSTPQSNRSNFFLGVVFMIIGALIVAIAFGFIHISSLSINATPWALTLFGLIFFVPGLWMVIQGAAGSRKRWVNYGFALVMLLLFSVFSLWIGFGPGRHQFMYTYKSGVDTISKPVSEMSGRIFFGIFGVLVSGVTVVFGINQLRRLLKKA